MRTLKQVIILLTEIVAEALLLGCLFGVLVSGQIGMLNGVIGSVLAVPVVLFLHWYYLTRVLVVITRYKMPRVYPFFAATLFVIHMHVVFVRLKPNMSSLGRATEFPFLAGGACIVIACAYGGTWLLRMWIRRSAGTYPMTPRTRTKCLWRP